MPMPTTPMHTPTTNALAPRGALLIGAALLVAVAVAVALGAAGCGAPAASLDDGAAPEVAIGDRLDALRAEVAFFEGRRVLERDRDAITRMNGWLDAMAGASDSERAAYEQVVRAHLEYLRSTELRYYPDEATR
jgi:hypothetical protein